MENDPKKIRTDEKPSLLGELTFEDNVIKKIISHALTDVKGLLSVDGGFFSNVAERMSTNENATSGIETEVGKKQVAVDMKVVVEYGKDIQMIYEEIKKTITHSVAKMTHLTVVEVNVTIEDIKTKAEQEKDKKKRQEQDE